MDSRRLLLFPLPDVQDVSRAGLGAELLGPILAWFGKADLEAVALQFVDAERGLALESPLGVRGVNRLGLLRRIDLVRALEDVVADLDIVLIALKDQLGGL